MNKEKETERDPQENTGVIKICNEIDLGICKKRIKTCMSSKAKKKILKEMIVTKKEEVAKEVADQSTLAEAYLKIKEKN